MASTSSRPTRAARSSKRAVTSELGGAVFTIDDVGAYLKLAKSTVNKVALEGAIPSQKVGRHWRFRKETIDWWPDRQDRTDK